MESHLIELEGLIQSMRIIFDAAWDAPSPEAHAFAVVAQKAVDTAASLRDELGLGESDPRVVCSRIALVRQLAAEARRKELE
jgi:hypothetical protein